VSLFDIDTALERGDLRLEWRLQTDSRWLGLFGVSGAGKTTCLELALGWVAPDRGHIRIGRGQLQMGYAPQDFLLFPHWTVEANLRAGERAGALVSPERFQQVLRAFELEELLGRSAANLSGGEARRVALARAILNTPDDGLLILDEPLSSLDHDRRRLVLGLLLDLKRTRCGPALIVSHSAADLQVLCDEVQVLGVSGAKNSFGAPGHPALLLSEAGGFENVLSARVLSVSGDSALCVLVSSAGNAEADHGVQLTAPGRGLKQGDEVVLGLRADDVLLTLDDPGRVSARNVLEGVVEEIKPLSSYRTLGVRLGEDRGAPLFFTHITEGAIADLGLGIGSSVNLVFKTRSIEVLALSPN
jgi:molybdate transport system ATP-binding protein